MDREELIALLGRNEAFASAPGSTLAGLVDAGEIRSVDAGTELTRQGEAGESLWMLLEGEMEILVDGACVNRLSSPGEVLGEISAVSLTPATATVRSVGTASVLRIPHGPLHRVVESSPELAASVLRSMTKYLSRQ